MRPCLLLDVCPNHMEHWSEYTSPTYSSECLPKHGTHITVGASSVERLVMLFIDLGLHHSAWGKKFSSCTLSSEHVISQSKVCKKNFIACISLGRVFIIHFWVPVPQSKLHVLSTATTLISAPALLLPQPPHSLSLSLSQPGSSCCPSVTQLLFLPSLIPSPT